MNRRLFIAIDLPEEIKAAIRGKLKSDKEVYPDLYENARMIPETDWHITLLFLGEQLEEHFKTIEQVISDTIAQMAPMEIALQMVTTAPPHRPPRMIWVTTSTETNRILAPIKNAIEQALVKQTVRPQGEMFPTFHGHIMLARLPEGRRIQDHMISFPHALSFKPKTMDLMESHLGSTGAKYSLIKSIDFKPSI